MKIKNVELNNKNIEILVKTSRGYKIYKKNTGLDDEKLKTKAHIKITDSGYTEYIEEQIIKRNKIEYIKTSITSEVEEESNDLISTIDTTKKTIRYNILGQAKEHLDGATSIKIIENTNELYNDLTSKEKILFKYL